MDGDASCVPTSARGAPTPILPDSTSALPLRAIAPVRVEVARYAAFETPAHKIAEARLISGLTWDELARAMSVSRRVLHLWANGRPINASNEERLARLLAALRIIDRGTGSANRIAIMGPDSTGRVPLDLLANGCFHEFKAALGRGRGRNRSPSTPISAAARAERAPAPPAAYLNALQDPVSIEPMPLVRGRLLRRMKRSA